MVEYLLRRADLLHDPVFHNDNAIAQRHGLCLVMGDINENRIDTLTQFDDFRAHLVAQLCIQIGKRLVHQQRLRLAHNGAANRNALPLAAGQCLRLAVQILCDAENLRRLIYPAIDLALRYLAQFQRKGHILTDRHMGIQRIALEHHCNIPVLWLNFVHALVVNIQFALGYFFKACDHAQGGGFSATRRTNKHDKFLIRNLQIKILNSCHIAIIDFINILQCNSGHIPCRGAPAPSPVSGPAADLHTAAPPAGGTQSSFFLWQHRICGGCCQKHFSITYS